MTYELSTSVILQVMAYSGPCNPGNGSLMRLIITGNARFASPTKIRHPPPYNNTPPPNHSKTRLSSRHPLHNQFFSSRQISSKNRWHWISKVSSLGGLGRMMGNNSRGNLQDCRIGRHQMMRVTWQTMAVQVLQRPLVLVSDLQRGKGPKHDILVLLPSPFPLAGRDQKFHNSVHGDGSLRRSGRMGRGRPGCRAPISRSCRQCR